MSASLAPKLTLAALLGAVAIAGACGLDRAALPDLDDGNGGNDNPPIGGAGGMPDGPTVKRTVIERNPFGNVSQPQNLLYDGDFEWASPFADQYGWILDYGFDFSNELRVGATCHSGVKCVEVSAGDTLIGLGVGTDGVGVEAWFWAKPSEGASCEGLVAALIGDELLGHDFEAELSTDGEADERGYCRYAGTSGPRQYKTYLYIDNDTDVPFVIDDAVVQRVSANAAGDASAMAPPKPVSAALLPRLDEAKARLRTLSRPVVPPPSAAKRAFEAWAARPKGAVATPAQKRIP
jgi:hypothetical protein